MTGLSKTFTYIAQYWLVPGTDLIVILINKIASFIINIKSISILVNYMFQQLAFTGKWKRKYILKGQHITGVPSLMNL